MNTARLSGVVRRIGEEKIDEGMASLTATIEQPDFDGGSVPFEITAFGSKHVTDFRRLTSGTFIQVQGCLVQEAWPVETSYDCGHWNTKLVLHLLPDREHHGTHFSVRDSKQLVTNSATLAGKIAWISDPEQVHDAGTKLRRALIVCPFDTVEGKALWQSINTTISSGRVGSQKELRPGVQVGISGTITNRRIRSDDINRCRGEVLISESLTLIKCETELELAAQRTSTNGNLSRFSKFH